MPLLPAGGSKMPGPTRVRAVFDPFASPLWALEFCVRLVALTRAEPLLLTPKTWPELASPDLAPPA